MAEYLQLKARGRGLNWIITRLDGMYRVRDNSENIVCHFKTADEIVELIEEFAG